MKSLLHFHRRQSSSVRFFLVPLSLVLLIGLTFAGCHDKQKGNEVVTGVPEEEIQELKPLTLPPIPQEAPSPSSDGNPSIQEVQPKLWPDLMNQAGDQLKKLKATSLPKKITSVIHRLKVSNGSTSSDEQAGAS